MIINMRDAVIGDSQNRGGWGSEPQPHTESPGGSCSKNPSSREEREAMKLDTLPVDQNRFGHRPAHEHD